jgi:hypothetical protein
VRLSGDNLGLDDAFQRSFLDVQDIGKQQVCRDPTTVFRIRAFSAPAQFLVRLDGPVSRKVQLRVTDQYLRALARYVGTKEAHP